MEAQPTSLALSLSVGGGIAASRSCNPATGRAARFEFNGTGGELCGQMLVGLLLPSSHSASTSLGTGGADPPVDVLAHQTHYAAGQPASCPSKARAFCFVEVYLTALLIPLTYLSTRRGMSPTPRGFLITPTPPQRMAPNYRPRLLRAPAASCLAWCW